MGEGKKKGLVASVSVEGEKGGEKVRGSLDKRREGRKLPKKKKKRSLFSISNNAEKRGGKKKEGGGRSPRIAPG